MKWIILVAVACCSCMRQPSLPVDSKYSVTAMRNDSVWFGISNAFRLIPPGKQPQSIKEFNIRFETDLNYIGRQFPKGWPPNKITGCIEECNRSQSIILYNIPLKKGKYKIGGLDKRRKEGESRSGYWLVGPSGGAYKRYFYEGRNPGWIRVTRVDKMTNTVEGNFSISFDEDLKYEERLKNDIPPVAKFTNGLFRAMLKDVKLKE